MTIASKWTSPGSRGTRSSPTAGQTTAAVRFNIDIRHEPCHNTLNSSRVSGTAPGHQTLPFKIGRRMGSPPTTGFGRGCSMISCPRTSHDTIQVLVSGLLALLTLPGCSGNEQRPQVEEKPAASATLDPAPADTADQATSTGKPAKPDSSIPEPPAQKSGCRRAGRGHLGRPGDAGRQVGGRSLEHCRGIRDRSHCCPPEAR